MHKQITVGVIVIIALTAIGTNQAVQSQLERGNDPVGGDIVGQQMDFGIPDKITGLRDLKAAAPPAITGATDGGASFSDSYTDSRDSYFLE